MKIAFCTCVQLGLSCIETIIDCGYDIDLFITLKDEKAVNKSGRIFLNDIARTSGTELLKIDNINDAAVMSALKERQIDWLFIIGWSQIAGKDVLNASKRGALGMHPTLLPVGRGRASVPWAIIKGEKETGVTLFKLDEGVDTGPIVDQYRVSIEAMETAATLYEKICDAHRGLIIQNIDAVFDNSIVLTTQDDSIATEWPGRTAEDGELHTGLEVLNVDRMVRALTRPYPGAFLWVDGHKRKMIIWAGVAGSRPADGEVLGFADGPYTATEFEYI